MGPSATIISNHLGYAGLGAGLVLSTMGLFSSELLLLVGGLAIRQGNLRLGVVIIIAVIAQLIGSGISYVIGRYGGLPLIENYGRYVLLSKRDLERAHRWFGRYGRPAAALGYCLPFLRGYIGYTAGIAEQPPRSFGISAFIGITIWTLILLALGYFLAGHLAAIEQVIRPFTYLILAALAAAIIYFFYHRLREVRS